MDPAFAQHDSFYAAWEWKARSWLQYGCESEELLKDWTALLALGDRVSPRKLRLFMCACCRHMWSGIAQEAHRRAVEVGEQFADGEVSDEVRAAAYQRGELTIGAGHHCCNACVAVPLLVKRVRHHAHSAAGPQYKLGSREERVEVTRRNQLHNHLLLRDVFADTFQPVSFSPSWRTDDAVALARQMYDSRDFGAMPILADALQDAGCDSEEVLSHCRGPGPHVRGCWVIDLVLGRS
jgi:hypothetical protein